MSPYKIFPLIVASVLSVSTISAQLTTTYSGKSNPHAEGLSKKWDCSECHSVDGINALIHPMFNLNPKSPQMSIPEDFPLSQKADLTCFTCHEAASKQTRSNRAFLRGGPYRRELEFCYNCHSIENYAKVNPHQQLREDGSINSTVCLHCHSRQPTATDHPMIAAELHGDMRSTCNKCHALHTHEQNHYGKNIPASKKATLKQYESTQKRYNIKLPLSQKNEIQCTTCHYIHGSLGIDAVVYAGSEENQHFLRLPREKLCYACHNL
ncbi:MAG: hypothetical protein K9M55_00015 [Candidatus Marinimicrobia bacterium]|nr:hypothetical protein [Candidatus Neomarinimicrobiota bacterium]